MAQQQNINDLLAAIQQLVQGNQALVTALQAAAPAGGAPAPLPPQPPVALQFAENGGLATIASKVKSLCCGFSNVSSCLMSNFL